MATTLREDAKGKEKKGKSPSSSSSSSNIVTSNHRRGPGKPILPGYVAKVQANAAKSSPSSLPFHHCKPISNFLRSNRSTQIETPTYVVKRRAPEVPVTIKKASPNRRHSMASTPSSSSSSRVHKPAPSSNARAEQLFYSLTAAPKPSPLVPKSSPIAPKPSPSAPKPSPVVPKPTQRAPRSSSVAPKPSPVTSTPPSLVPKSSSKSMSLDRVAKPVKAVKFQQPLVEGKRQNKTSSTPAKKIYEARGTIHPAERIPLVRDEEVLTTSSDSKQEDKESLMSDVHVEEVLAKIESRILECPPPPLEKLAPEHEEKGQDVNSQDEAQQEAEEVEDKEIYSEETKSVEEKSKIDDIKEEEQRETQDTAVNTTLAEKETVTGEGRDEEHQEANRNLSEPEETIAAEEKPIEAEEKIIIEEEKKPIEADERIAEEKKIIVVEETIAEDKHTESAEEKIAEEEKPMEAEETIAKEENSATKEEEISEQEHRRGGPSSRTGSPVSNDVIEETTGKLIEKRKNKVLAMAGAFENVISLQKSSSGRYSQGERSAR